MNRYAIWDKTSPVIVPTGKVFTAAEWMDKYPAARLENVTVVCSAGEVNGGFFGTLGQMVQMYAAQGADFTGCTTAQEKLAVIEAFEDAANAPGTDPTAEERIAAALEYQVMASLPDEDGEEPVSGGESAAIE